ncbi:hypothetical protein [Arsukibacterium sp.]|uniref:hypothetical protein n=1 Tax=Arsukibacterium sp. TaxID=1977258 RepID=UPI001BD409F8|nr:hypothetical protein [Arsukibacterium sp.]
MKKILLIVAVFSGVLTGFLFINKEPENASASVAAPGAVEKTSGHIADSAVRQGAPADSNITDNNAGRQVQESSANDNQIVNNQTFDSQRFNSLLFSDDFMTETPNYITANQTNESVENQLYLYQTFYDSLRNTPEFSNLSLELAECDIDLCIVSLAGVEQLSKDEISQLEDELLFNKQGLSKVAVNGGGGTYGMVEKDGYSYFRIVYITNSRFVGVN